MASPFLQVALPIPKEPFTYEIPQTLDQELEIGQRVKIPFHRDEKVGIVTSFVATTEFDNTRPVSEMIDSVPVISPEQFALAKWIADNYYCSLGEALFQFIPSLLRRGRKLKEIELKEPIPLPEESFQFALNVEQQEIVTDLKAKIQAKAFHESLIKGVTGSGKTEVYLRLIFETLKQGRNVICLVPEIALTHQLTKYFQEHLGDLVEVLHSRLTDAERLKAWIRIKSGEKRVILGPRSSLFSPLSNIGLILMDEEHESSFKQEDGPRYHTREVARELAKKMRALFVMGTATPSVETFYRANQGEIAMHRMDKRISDRPLPEVHVVDLKNEMTKGGNLLFSRPLRSEIQKRIEKREKIVLFLNRRGYASFFLCVDCGETMECPSCKVSLTYHKFDKRMICHYCNYQTTPPEKCPSCQSLNIKTGGVGTEKVEAEVRKYFPELRIDRLDTDRVKKKGEMESIIKNFLSGKLDVLIGTQMLAKGFHFPDVTLVGVINADSLFAIPDFRAFERGFQLLTQVSGRTGRGDLPGKVLIQTFMPDNHSIQMARQHDYDAFYQKEIQTREELLYPPFSRVVNIIFRSKDEKKLLRVIDELQEGLLKQQWQSVEILGPSPLPFYKLRNYYRWHVMLKAKEDASFRPLLNEIQKFFAKKRQIYCAIDVDPQTIL